jgi:hypothetical protein
MKLIASQSGAMISGPVLNALVFLLLYFPTFLCYIVRNFFLLSDGSIRIGIRLVMLAKHFILINQVASTLNFFSLSVIAFILLLVLRNSLLFFWFIRVEYKQLDKLRDVLLEVPFVALTATATEKYVPRVFV